MVLRRPRPAAESPLRLEEVPDPRPGPDEILIRVSACAVCRTDLQLAEGDLRARRLPVVPGHQVVGVVEALGDAVTGWAPGDRAGVHWLAGVCGVCRFCTTDRENLCIQARFTGWDRDGGFAELVTARADVAVPLPAGIGDVEAAPLLCGGVIGLRALRVSGVRPGERLGLFGFGASALNCIQVARHWGCRVFVLTRSAAERDRARALGAEWAGDYRDDPPEPLDAAVTFAPAGWVVTRALSLLDRGGTVAVNAIHLDGIPAFPYADLWWERTLASVANVTRTDARDLVALAADIPIRTSVERYRLEDANDALRAVADGSVRGAAVLLPGRPAA